MGLVTSKLEGGYWEEERIIENRKQTVGKGSTCECVSRELFVLHMRGEGRHLVEQKRRESPSSAYNIEYISDDPCSSNNPQTAKSQQIK